VGLTAGDVTEVLAQYVEGSWYGFEAVNGSRSTLESEESGGDTHVGADVEDDIPWTHLNSPLEIDAPLHDLD
jgi:hypothetical protein